MDFSAFGFTCLKTISSQYSFIHSFNKKCQALFLAMMQTQHEQNTQSSMVTALNCSTKTTNKKICQMVERTKEKIK